MMKSIKDYKRRKTAIAAAKIEAQVIEILNKKIDRIRNPNDGYEVLLLDNGMSATNPKDLAFNQYHKQPQY